MAPVLPGPLPPHPAAVVISNPRSGGAGRQSALREAVGALADLGWTIDWRRTEGPGHATDLARSAANDGADVVVAAGGDGTINEVVNGVVGTVAALGILPAGTGNVMAAQLGLVGVPTPLHRPDLTGAAVRLAAGTVRQVDTGLAIPRAGPQRHFLLLAGVGLDAAVTEEVESSGKELKKAVGPAAFGALGLKALMGTSGTDAVVRYDGRRARGRLLLAIVSNIRLYAGAVELTPEAAMDDGLFDMEVFFGDGPLDTVAHIGALLTGRHEARRLSHQPERVRIVTSEPMPVHVDGEPYAKTPVEFRVAEGSLLLVAPEGAAPQLFHREVGGAAPAR